MPWSIVADSDDIRPKFKRLIAYRLTVIRISDHRRQIALGQTKTGQTIPGNFHDASNDGELYHWHRMVNSRHDLTGASSGMITLRWHPARPNYTSPSLLHL